MGEEDAFDEIVRRLRGRDTATTEAVKRELQRLALPERDREPPAEPGKDWCIVRVELVSGLGETFDPPPGRDILISPQHTYRQLAETINQAFARWDLGHLYVFRLADGSEVGTGGEELPFREAARTKLGTRRVGEEFGYEFDFGDSWEHRCTVLEAGLDPEDTYGVRPKGPAVVWGWGATPDQYGRTTPEG